jgi:hypothetical protein
VSRVHRTVDWRPDCGPWSMVDHSHGWRPKLISIPVRGTLPWWHGEQEKGMGIPYLDWHEEAEGLEWPGLDEGRRQRSELNEKMLEAWR